MDMADIIRLSLQMDQSLTITAKEKPEKNTKMV